MNEVEEAIFDTLTAGQTGSGQATGIYVAGGVPQNAPLPYVVFQKMTGRDAYTFSNHRTHRDLVYLVKAVDQGHSNQRAGVIMNQVEADLHNAALVVTGYTTMLCRRERDMPSYNEMSGGMTYQHVGALYRIFVAPT